MSARLILTGSLAKPLARKTTSKGNAYVLASIREGKGDDARYWSAFVFGETAISAFEQLQPGEPVAVAGEFDAKIYAKDGGESRVSFSIKVDGVLSARRPLKDKRAPASNQAPTNQTGGRDFDDTIPFLFPNLRRIAIALRGEVSGNQVLAPGPNHNDADRSLAVRLSPSAPDGFLAFSHAGDDWRTVRDYVREKLGISLGGFASSGGKICPRWAGFRR